MNITIILLISYFVAVLAIGYFSSRKEKKEDFMIAGRKLSPWVVAFTIAAGLIGGNTLVNYSGFVFTYGLSILWGILGFIFGIILLALFSKKIKKLSDKHKFHTMADYFGCLYGNKTSLIATIILSSVIILSLIVQFIAGAKLITAISSLSFVFAVLLMGVIVLVYSILGGFRAIVKTDVFQYLLFFVLLFIVGFSVSKGVTVNVAEVVDFSNSGIGLIIAFFIIGAGFVLSAPEVWQRIYAGKTSKSVKKGLILAAILCLVAFSAIMILGLSARAHFPNTPPEEAAIVGLTQLLPPALLGIGIILFFAVIMSTIDSLLFIISTNFSKDICYRINKKIDLRKYTRIGLVLFTFIATMIAISYQDILALGLSFTSLVIAFAPIVIGSFIAKLKSRAINLALIVSFVVVLGLLFAGFVNPMTSVISLPVSLVFLLLGQWLFKKKIRKKINS